MRAETRHQLKQDRFSQATFGAAEATAHWTVEHKSKLIVGGVALVVVLAAAFGGWYYLNQQDQKASIQLNQAVRTLDTSVRPAGSPAEADFPSFASAKERATRGASSSSRQSSTVIPTPERRNLPGISSGSLLPNLATMLLPNET